METDGNQTASALLDTFTYSPLPTPTSIRLVQIRRGTPRIFDPCERTALIECHIKTVDLETNPSYTALSYTWGAPQTTHHIANDEISRYDVWRVIPICLNNRSFRVARNLHSFLQKTAQELFLPGLQFGPYDRTALHDAAGSGDVDETRSLIDSGAMLSVPDSFGKTPLHYAAAHGLLEVVKLLVNAGACVWSIDKNNRTPEICAAHRRPGHWREIVALLQDAEGKSACGEEPSSLTEWFWIDAICIDQNNDAERSAQVSLMPHIFKQASTVLVWLGGMPNWFLDSFRPWIDSGIENHQFYSQVEMLLSGVWFTRLWVVQEISLASKAVVMYGRFRFAWVDILRILATRLGPAGRAERTRKLLEASDSDSRMRYEHYTDASVVLFLRLAFAGDSEERRIFGWPDEPGSRVSLPLLLALTRRLRCLDPRDHVFALLSIAEPMTIEPELRVDYTQPVEHVFLAAAHHFIRGSGNNSLKTGFSGRQKIYQLDPLEALSHVQHWPVVATRAECYRPRREWHPGIESHVQRLPSWVPDFHTPLISDRIFHSSFSAASHVPGIINLDVREGIPSSVLGLKGLVFDTIRDIEDRSIDVSDDSRFFSKVWVDMVRQIPEPYPRGIDSRLDVFRKTMRAGHPHRDWKFGETFWQVEYLYLNFKWPDIPWSFSAYCAVLEFLNEPLDLTSHPMTIQSAKLYAWRRFFLTKQGYFGLGPQTMQKGDLVLLVAGARTPFVMRPRQQEAENEGDTTDAPKRYELIGEAYVHGIMHGEAVSKNGEEFEDIEID